MVPETLSFGQGGAQRKAWLLRVAWEGHDFVQLSVPGCPLHPLGAGGGGVGGAPEVLGQHLHLPAGAPMGEQ